MNTYSKLDVLAGERWFPKETNSEIDMTTYWGDWGCNSEVDELKAVMLRRPGKEIEDFDYMAARFMQPINVDKFRKQHDQLANVYRENGVKVYYVENQREDKPNALFVRDHIFMTPEGAILARPGMAMRRGEERYTAQALSNLGVPIVRTISGDGIFEGANAMWVDRNTVILSSGARANKAGVAQMEYELKRMGVTEIIHMQIPYGHAHIDGILNIASHDVAMVYAPQVPYDVIDKLKRKGFKILECPSVKEAKETFAINYVALKPGLVVQPDGNPRSRELLEKNGIEVIPIDFSEIVKGWGAMHCCTAFLKRG